ncbi:hypothetical protein [Candidatus Villigracilis affinis]|uniref:hypothetical protein n=1 Tax=Candidatus Villigracilis affinis TaxID=3140682 RepID=UPI002A19D5CA|nr:hypothetical protein [Anaerolineales bacterium]
MPRRKDRHFFSEDFDEIILVGFIHSRQRSLCMLRNLGRQVDNCLSRYGKWLCCTRHLLRRSALAENGIIDSDNRTFIWPAFDVIQMIEDDIGPDFRHFSQRGHGTPDHIVVSRFQQLDEILGVGAMSSGSMMPISHGVDAVPVNVLVFVPHVCAISRMPLSLRWQAGHAPDRDWAFGRRFVEIARQFNGVSAILPMNL